MSYADEMVRQWMQKVERSGEMRGIAGKPLELDDGFDQTPQELRMAHKILKNAGYVPAEVEEMQQIADLRASLAGASDEARKGIERKIANLDTLVRIRLESLRSR